MVTGERFTLVDAAFGPIFRCFDVFDMLVDTGIFVATLAFARGARVSPTAQSVRDAVAIDDPQRLRAFLAAHDAWLLRPQPAAA